MVNTLEFDSNAPGSTPGPAAIMESYIVDSSGGAFDMAALETRIKQLEERLNVKPDIANDDE